MPPDPRKPVRPSADQLVTADYSSQANNAPKPVGPAPRAMAVGTMLGKYRITGIIGRGGMGNVYAAKDPLIKRDVAIKMLPPDMVRDKATLDRFLAEAQAAGKLNHPHVLTV